MGVFSGGNKVALLQGGDELFPAMIKTIERARHEVWVATYIFNDDPAARSVLVALFAAVQRGVNVRLLVDGFGTNGALQKLAQECRQHGVTLAVFRPLHRWKSWFQPGQLRRMHQKLCVVDEEAAFVGGVNLIDDHFDLRHGWSERPRLDFSVQIHGPAVISIRQTIRALWTRSWLGQELREELLALAHSSHRWSRIRKILKRVRMERTSKTIDLTEPLKPVQVAFVVRDNLRQRRTIERHYISAIRQAQNRIDLICPYFYPGRAFRRALIQAARRGVQVRLVLQGRPDYQMARFAASALYAELQAAGVRIFEYMPAFLHAKVALVDHDWATVGSSNIDPLSLLLNLEANIVVRDIGFNAELAVRFEDAVSMSVEVDDQFIKRLWYGPWRRALVASLAHIYLRVAGRSGRY
ncbi:MAG: cardiolipin synthase ClsB [Burkholderiales bacterium]